MLISAIQNQRLYRQKMTALARTISLIAAALLVTLLLPSFAQANDGSWGSHGSSGGMASSGGSWGSRGGLLNGRRPVRTLLNRIGNRITSLGSSGGSSGGSFGSSGGRSLSRRSYSSFGSIGGSSGGSLGSSGGTAAVTPSVYCSPQFVSSTTSNAPLATQQYAAPIETSYTMPSTIGNSFSMEQSYPVGDYGFVPGYPTYETQGSANSFGSPTSSGTIEGGGGVDINQALPSTTDSEYYEQNGVTPAPTEGGGSEPTTPGVDEGDSTLRSNSNGSSDRAVLTVSVPREAKVYINDQLTKTPGSKRSYEGTDLDADLEYHYHVKAELERDGKKIVRSKMVVIRPGFDQEVDLNFEQPPVTVLALEVPKNAKVKLCGNETQLTGKQRKFVTTELADGEICEDYQVEVSYQMDGEWVTDVKKIDLAAGDARSLDFTPTLIAMSDKDDKRVASR